MNKKWMLGALSAIEDKLDFPPEKNKDDKYFQPLLTPETYNLLHQKYGGKDPLSQMDKIEEKIKASVENILTKTGYVLFENSALKRETLDLKRENKEMKGYIAGQEKVIKNHRFKIRGLKKKLRKDKGIEDY